MDEHNILARSHSFPFVLEFYTKPFITHYELKPGVELACLLLAVASQGITWRVETANYDFKLSLILYLYRSYTFSASILSGHQI